MQREARRPGGDLADATALAVLWVPYALLVRHFWFVTDDAFISFRYARNWAQGQGLRFNPGAGDPVEGFSNFLWVAAAALLESLGASSVLWMPWVSFACGTLLLWRVFAVLRLRVGLDPPLATLAAAFLALSPAAAVHATSGLETAAFCALLFLAFEQLLFARGRAAELAAGAAGLGLALIRVEGLAWALLLVPLAAVSRRLAGLELRRPLALYGAVLLGGTIGFLAWRWATFGSLVSNTAVAKAGAGWAFWARGAAYAVHYVLSFLSPLALIAAAPACLRRESRALGVPVLALALAVYGYAAVVGGDFMAMGRFLVPALPFQALAVGIALRAAAAHSPARLRAWSAAALGLIGVGLLPAWDLHVAPRALRARLHVHGSEPYLSERQRWAFQRENTERWSRLGEALREQAPPGASVVLGAIGAVGYYSGLHVYDRNGIIDPEVAARPLRALRYPGHDREVSSGFFLPRRPTYLVAELSDGQTAAQVAAVLRSHAATLREAGLDRDYAPRAVRTAFRDGAGRSAFLVLVERIPPGADPAAVWARFAREIDALEAEEGE